MYHYSRQIIDMVHWITHCHGIVTACLLPTLPPPLAKARLMGSNVSQAIVVS